MAKAPIQVSCARAIIVAASVAAVASGCTMLRPPSPKPVVPATLEQPEAPPPAPVQPPPRPARKPAPPNTATAPVLTPEAPPAEANFDRLQGLDQDETMAVLGEPLQRAESPPATVWHYASADCELDVYFYLDLKSNEMRVLHYEVRSNGGTEQLQQRCYSELVTERHAGAEPSGTADSTR